MTTQPPVSLSHTGFHVFDMDKMVAFYTRVFGFQVTDRADDGRISFMSADPKDHHQLILFKGRTAKADETHFAHVAFRVRDLSILRRIGEQLAKEDEASEIYPCTHGNAWSIYFKDPEGNEAEAFVDTPWYVAQPFREPMDILGKTDDEIYEWTEKLLESYPTKQPVENWRNDLARKIGVA